MRNFQNFLLVMSIAIVVISKDQNCIIDENLRAKHLAKKTPYEFVKPRHPPMFEIPQNCTPEKFWFISRHGTRYPGIQDGDAISRILPNLIKNSNLCQRDMELLLEWQPDDLDSNRATFLHPEGEKEFRLMAENYQNMFPDLLSANY